MECTPIPSLDVTPLLLICEDGDTSLDAEGPTGAGASTSPTALHVETPMKHSAPDPSGDGGSMAMEGMENMIRSLLQDEEGNIATRLSILAYFFAGTTPPILLPSGVHCLALSVDLFIAFIVPRITVPSTASLCTGNTRAQNQFYQIGGVDMVQHILWHVQPLQLQEEPVDPCMAALATLLESVEPHARLREQVVTQLVFNLRLWGYGAPARLQHGLLALCSSWAVSNIEDFR